MESRYPDEDRELLCALEPDELRQKGQDLARAVSEVERHEREKSEAMGIFKTRIDGAKARTLELRDQVESKTEPRVVRCFWQRAVRGKRELLELVRSDTGAPIATRELTSADLQESLDLGAN